MTRTLTSCSFDCDVPPCCQTNTCGVPKDYFGTCENSLITTTCPDGSNGSGVVSSTKIVYKCGDDTITLTR